MIRIPLDQRVPPMMEGVQTTIDNGFNVEVHTITIVGGP